MCIIQVSSGCFQFPYCLLNVFEFFNGCIFFELCNGCLLTVQLMSPSCAMGVVLVSFGRTTISTCLAEVLLGFNGCVQVVSWMFYDCLCMVYHVQGVSWMFRHIRMDVFSLANSYDCPKDVNGCFVIVQWVSSSCPMDVLLESVGCQ